MVDTWHFSKGNPDFALLKPLPGDCLVSVQVADAIRDPRPPMALVAASISAEGADYIKNLVGRHPIQRQAEPMEIAYGVLFLASDEASHITGAQLPIDGGYTAQ
jgi:NAD(P)-dependent dehydrogenase (short-subunit alcohol dehydrogenase family)